MNEQPTLEDQSAFFDNWNEKYRRVGYDEVEPESKARAERVLQLLGSLPLKRPSIVEVGCGTGWLTERLVTFGPTIAIDLSPKAIEIANRRGLDAEFVAGNFCEHEFSDGGFDVGVCLETISVVPDQLLFMAKLATAIKPGGYLILTTQNKFVYDRRRDIRPPDAGNIRRWLNRRDLKRLLRREFRLIRLTSVLPKGDMGILRVVHSFKVDVVLSRFLSRSTIVALQEKLGLGHTLVALAQRRRP
jgi:2-polyprenyl-3-methyl-5-hydroxy-6-metoxy-1,4-benzoquinol methylase